MAAEIASPVLRWGPFELDRARRLFRRGGEEVAIQPRAFDVLVLLAERLDEAVSREELLATAWEGAVVVDGALTQVIRKLRAALRDPPDAPRWLLTVPRFGYRLCSAEPAQALIGRADELGWLRSVVAGGARVITICAPGGAGKTSLARAWLSTSGGIEVSCRGVVTAASLAARLREAACAPSDEPDELAAAIRASARDLFLDDAEALDRSAHALAEACAGDRVRLHTARGPLSLPGEVVLPLAGLSQAAASSWLVSLAPGWSDLGTATQIAEAVGGSPLALMLVAGRAAEMSAAEALARLERGERLSLLGRPVDGQHDTLSRCLALATEPLGEPWARALRACACFAGPFSAQDAQEALGVSEALLEELHRRRLVRRAGAKAFAMAGPEREHARELLRASSDGEALQAMWRRWALREGRPAELQAVATDLEDPEQAALALLRLFDDQGGAGSAWLDEIAAGIEAAAGPRPEVDLVRAAWEAGQDIEAAKARCRSLCDAPDRNLAARGWLGLAGLAAATADLDGAREAAEKAIALAANARTHTRARTIAGWVAIREGHPDRALEVLHGATDLETDDRTRAGWLSALAAARRALGDAAGAEAALREALALETPGNRVAAGLLANLGGLLAERGALDEATEQLALAVDAFVADRDRRGEAEARYGLGLVALARERLAEADAELRRAEAVAGALGDTNTVRRVRVLQAALALQRGARVEARLHAAESAGAPADDGAALLAWLDGAPVAGSGPWARGARGEIDSGPAALSAVIRATFRARQG